MVATRIVLAAGVLVAAAAPALADSISPLVFTSTIAVGETATVGKLVTITAGRPTSAQADIYFLTDTTGSMGSEIAAVQAGFTTIVNGLTGIGNLAFGAGEFRDTSDVLALNSGSYQVNQAISGDPGLTRHAIMNWSAGGGGDTPEQNLAALRSAAGAGTGWREGSRRIVVMTSDAPSHDTTSPPVALPGTSVAQTAADLAAAGVTTLAVNSGDMNAKGQFSGPGGIFAAGASGAYLDSLATTTLVGDILTAIGSAFATYRTVTLDLGGVPAGLRPVLAPGSYVGSFDRSVDRHFAFTLGFVGLAPGTYDFTVRALADGGIIATERDTITVTGLPPNVPEPAALGLFGLALVGLCVVGRHRLQEKPRIDARPRPASMVVGEFYTSAKHAAKHH